MSAPPNSLQSVFDRAFAGLSQGRETFSPQLTPREVGTVTSVATGIAKVVGLPGVGFDELVTFPGDVLGIAFNVDADEVGVVLLGEYWHLQVGDDVQRTGRVMDVPVGEGLPGRVIDPLSRPLDGNGPLASSKRLPVTVPNSVKAITPLVGQILIESETRHGQGEVAELYLFHNRPTSGAAYEPVSQRLLPLDESWQREFAEPWPKANLPEVLGSGTATLRALISEYLFVSLFKACAESLASENASRLAAMQRADKNIEELLEHLNRTFHRLRQSSIDEELFDVVAGFESLSAEP